MAGDWLLGFNEFHETVVGDQPGSFHLAPLSEGVGFDRSATHEFVEFGSSDTEQLDCCIHPDKLGLHIFGLFVISHYESEDGRLDPVPLCFS